MFLNKMQVLFLTFLIFSYLGVFHNCGKLSVNLPNTLVLIFFPFCFEITEQSEAKA